MTTEDTELTHVHEGSSIGAMAGRYRGVWRLTERTFDSKGVNIHFHVWGRGKPVVLLHGFGSRGDDWEKTAKHLARSHTVIAIDMRGHGTSDTPHTVGDYGENMVADVIRLLDHLKIEKAHMVGYSMGGFVLMKLLTEHPERVSAAVLGGSGGVRRSFPLYEWAQCVATSMENGKTFGDAINDAQSLVGDDTEVHIAPRGEDTMALAAVARSWRALEVRDSELKEITVPTLVLYGSKEVRINHDYVNSLREVRPDWEYTEIEGADHGSAFGNEKFCNELKKFLSKQAARN
jgi:pimeloyl-ACP methyl ester carboxylesterase